ncbi:hypothetical protein H8356DRAFT_1728845 [Neocallimastix lanati (nom. inval.)]|uniref:Uncharacterized protein n=1 Tax=Neocallimastix californiae TaxID=1754190 RepID=A0A1Y2AIJ4_9FUNG|nr:hypothetical protein H8356DRAFT_1728845 [Neocallimastix sp. JGI-2020a]ORY22304.1 hypothetical protein LY90DRAFT_707199 [Neocallimastix californiae]|eukprot:ORY22304.1 hypothetical protein LY90DRAFT_707199 [Neocallimastix californiae]
MIYYWSPYPTSYLVGGAVPAGLPYSFSVFIPYPSIITACYCTIILQMDFAATISVIT